jgi:hypothetical protein
MAGVGEEPALPVAGHVEADAGGAARDLLGPGPVPLNRLECRSSEPVTDDLRRGHSEQVRGRKLCQQFPEGLVTLSELDGRHGDVGLLTHSTLQRKGTASCSTPTTDLGLHRRDLDVALWGASRRLC